MTLPDAFGAYLEDLRARHLSASSVRGYKALFRALEPFAAERGARLLREVDSALLLAWRTSWTWAPRSFS